MLVLLRVSDGALGSRNTAAAAPSSIGSPKGVPASVVDLGSSVHHVKYTNLISRILSQTDLSTMPSYALHCEHCDKSTFGSTH